jgi:hypothetical protein
MPNPYFNSRVFSCLVLVLPDQPNREVRTCTLRGVGGGSREASPYTHRMPLTDHYVSSSYLLILKSNFRYILRFLVFKICP